MALSYNLKVSQQVKEDNIHLLLVVSVSSTSKVFNTLAISSVSYFNKMHMQYLAVSRIMEQKKLLRLNE